MDPNNMYNAHNGNFNNDQQVQMMNQNNMSYSNQMGMPNMNNSYQTQQMNNMNYQQQAQSPSLNNSYNSYQNQIPQMTRVQQTSVPINQINNENNMTANQTKDKKKGFFPGMIVGIIIGLLIGVLITSLYYKQKDKSNNKLSTNLDVNESINTEEKDIIDKKDDTNNLNNSVSFDNSEEIKDYDSDGEFLFSVEDIFTITGRGTVATGRVEKGNVKVGDEVEIIGLGKENITTRVTGLEMFRKNIAEASAGDNVGILLQGITREEVLRGQVIAKIGTVKAHKKFKADVYVLSKDEGGRHTPFFDNYRPQFYFRTAEIAGTVKLPNGIEMGMPGENIELTIELVDSVAMEEGLEFSIREGGRTIGKGIVKEIIE